jgi:hypothetical protein
VIQGGVTNSSFTYEIPADSTKPTRHNILSFTTFSHEGSVVVEVTQLAGTPITNASVHPTSYGIPVTIVAPNKVRFTVPGPMRKMAVIFNNDWVTHPLLVFADPLEVNPPAGPSANVLYYGPGVHNPGQIQINSGQTLYLAGGAYVKGWIEESGLNSVKILGRGILSAEDRPDTGAGLDTKTISLEGGNGNHVVDGITLIQSVGFTCTLRGPQLDNFLVEIAGQVARPAPPALSLESGVGGQWRLHWDAAGFLLQEAPTVSGPWTNRVPQPSSPFPLSPTGVAGFYRLRWTGP